TVTLTVTPDNGYELETLTVMNGATAVAVTPSDEEGKYTFVMPAAAVNVNATFTAIDYTITIADGIENGTVVADRPVANIGDIVTLTVTPNIGYELETLTVMNGATAVAVTPSDEEGKYTFVMPAAAVNVNATFSCIPISQDGDTCTIYTAEGWDLFCDMLAEGESFSGKTVKLDADITVSRMAGKTGSDDSTPFGGTFDGCGHTLTFNYTGSEDFIAPFSWTTWTNSPIFRNLTIGGTINTTGAYAAGLVGHLYGTVTVEHCTSTIDITCASGGSGFVGLCEHTVNFSDCLSSAVIHSKGGNNSGFVGWSRASGYAINFTGCVFNGKLLQIDGEGGINGGFIGWTGSNKTVTITDCLVNPAALAAGETMATGSTATFARGWNATTTATNSYYTAALGAPQCTQARSITAGENVTTLENAGTPATVYSVSGITAYPTGIKYNGVLFAGDGDEVSLTLGHSDLEDDTFNSYQASAGTLSGSANPYTLTMPDQNVTITALYMSTALRGDVNGDSKVDITDATMLINYLLSGNPAGMNLTVADVNDDKLVDITDATMLINYLLSGTW
ncbi:MAG: hypothetical protein IKX18_07610, partial [Muribaculaceae bacterium]|nr:hypothetical protein [Muribaculaceae bacterium]